MTPRFVEDLIFVTVRPLPPTGAWGLGCAGSFVEVEDENAVFDLSVEKSDRAVRCDSMFLCKG